MAPIHLEVTAVFSLTALILVHSGSRTVKRCLTTLHRPGNATLLLHVAVSLAEVVRYYARYISCEKAQGAEVHSGIPDLVLMGIQCGTSFQLAKSRDFVGRRSITRPVYQAQTASRMLFSALSFGLSQPWLHRASILVNASFVYPRLFIWAVGRLHLRPLGRYGDVYTTAVFASALLAMHDSGVPLAPQVWLASLLGLMALERWVAERVLKMEQHAKGEHHAKPPRIPYIGGPSKERQQAAANFVAQLLQRAGFVDVELLAAYKGTGYGETHVATHIRRQKNDPTGKLSRSPSGTVLNPIAEQEE